MHEFSSNQEEIKCFEKLMKAVVKANNFTESKAKYFSTEMSQRELISRKTLAATRWIQFKILNSSFHAREKKDVKWIRWFSNWKRIFKSSEWTFKFEIEYHSFLCQHLNTAQKKIDSPHRELACLWTLLVGCQVSFAKWDKIYVSSGRKSDWILKWNEKIWKRLLGKSWN